MNPSSNTSAFHKLRQVHTAERYLIERTCLEWRASERRAAAKSSRLGMSVTSVLGFAILLLLAQITGDGELTSTAGQTIRLL